MGTTAQKLQRVLDTKEGLKDTINTYLGQDITSAIPFKDYETYIKNFYGSLPKTSYAEGSNITLSNCLKGKLDFEDGIVGYGDTEQDTTNGYQLIPFPYYDSDIDDRNGVKWTVNNDGTINASGTANSSSSIFYLTNGDSDIYLEAGTYKISTNLFTDINGFSIQAISIVNGSYGTVYWSDMVLTETTRLRIRVIAKPNTTVNVQNAYMMINSGSTAQPYEPYTGGQASPSPSYPQEIEVVTGEQSVVVSGKNLVEGLELGEINAQTGVEVSAAGVVRTINYIPYSRLKSYRQSVNGENLSSGTNLRFYNQSKEYIGYASFSTTSSIQDVSITIGSGVTTTDLEPKYFRIRVGTSVLQTDSKYMIATDNDLTYEPYITPTSYQLSLGDRKVFEGDYFWIDTSTGKKYHHHKFSDITFTGASGEIWADLSIGGGGNKRTYIVISNAPSTPSPRTQIYSNYFKYNDSYATDKIGSCFIAEKKFYVYPEQDNLTSFKTWLSTHNTETVYPLETETDEEITGTLAEQLETWYKAQSINGTTIITSNGDLPLVIKVRGLKGE